MRWRLAFAWLLIAAAALGLRLPRLAERPFHGDEAVHAVKFHDLLVTRSYRYDPNEFHGPTLYYATLPVWWLSGTNDWVDWNEAPYRLVTIAVAVAGLACLLLLVDGLGPAAVLVAALLVAVSAPMTYYSRYYIQETLLNTFVLAAVGCGWRASRTRSVGWAVGAGIAAGLAIATKETVVFCVVAAGLALLPGVRRADRETRRLWLIGGVAAVVTTALLLAGFGGNLAGPIDYLKSYAVWLQRAGGTDVHNHPWHYYLSTLAYTKRGKRAPVWSEGLTLALAVVGIIAVVVMLRRRQADDASLPDLGLSRFILLYTLILTAIYSAVSYKTPWCVLTFLQGLALLAGLGVASLSRVLRRWWLQVPVFLLVTAGAAQLAHQTWRLAGDYATDGRNPWAYAHTVPDVVELGTQVEEIARLAPTGLATPVVVLATDTYYWPIPWYLRRLEQVGYFAGQATAYAAPIIIASTDYEEALSPALAATHTAIGYRGLRPEVLYVVWVETPLWERFLASRGATP